jgi:para-nitrobenzyl esterase
MKFAASLVVAFTLFGTTSFAQTVAVTGGQIRGAMLEKGGAVFKGIPFAAPPVGDLRWREPMPVIPWNGVRDATAFGAMCPQRSSPNRPDAAETAREDCLFLNVWNAEWPVVSRKPVMVWVHGGGNFAGSSSQPEFDDESLARRGVVLVSFNYRVGSFGFFSHPALTRESPNHASGNQGILDQIAALKWVRDNIANFGGDPNNVTIFGESAGSIDVSALMTSPLSKGLFLRVIGESGPAIFADNLLGKANTLAQAERRGESLASRWKVSANASATQLRQVSTADILGTEPDYIQANSGYKITAVIESFPYLGIVVDGYVFPMHPAEVFAAGQEHRVGLLLGSNARERIPGTSTPTDLAAAINDTFGPLAGRALTLYVGERDPIYGTPADQWATDASFRCSSVAQLAWHSSAGNPSYQFEFARILPGREAMGSHHAMEVSYVFGTISKGLIAGPRNPPVRPTEVDSQISDVMQQYWTNFAKTGDPNGPELPAWPKFDPTRRAYIQFTDAGPIAKESLRRPYCDLFIENVQRLMAR